MTAGPTTGAGSAAVDLGETRGTPKIIGLGLGRTGTNSLHAALVALGIDSVHHPPALTPADFELGTAFVETLRSHQAIANGTGSPLRLLDDRFPGSRFVLTVRNGDDWAESMRRYAALEEENWEIFEPRVQHSKRLVREHVFGGYEFDPARWRNVYERHRESVLAHFVGRDQDLLVFDLFEGDGWSELCDFLGRPVPPVPFPHGNSIEHASGWYQAVQRTWQVLCDVVPDGSRYAVIDDFELGVIRGNGCRFVDCGGLDGGPPPDDEAAIRALEHERARSLDLLFVASPSFWWFEHYAGFGRHLRRNYTCVADDELLVAFDLR